MPGPQDWLTRNMFLREVESPTDARGMQSPSFGGSPEQLMSIMQSPQMQQGLQQFLGPGYHFDPSQMRQSPFFPNQFMQHHPRFGGAMTGALANLASTPNPELVQGLGAGMNQAAQGMMGGPELLRQYQIRQMMAPMQAAGGMMPMQEFQRKQQLMNLLQQQSQGSMDLAEEEQERKKAADEQKLRIAQMQENIRQMQIEGQMPREGRYGITYPPTGQQPPQMGQMQGPGAIPGAQVPQQPGAPAQGPRYEPFNPALIAPIAAAKDQGKSNKPKPTSDKAYGDLETQKSNKYAALKKEYSPYWSDVHGKDYTDAQWNQERARKDAEFKQQQQGIEDWYARTRELYGAPVGGYQYPGQQSQYQPGIMAPRGTGGGGNQAGYPHFGPQNPPPPGAHVDDVGNYFDAQGNFLGYGQQQGRQPE